MSRASLIIFFVLGALTLGWAADKPIDNKSKEPGFVPAEVLDHGAPNYPEAAKKARLSGIVVLGAVIDEQGVPTQVRVLSSSGAALDNAAAEAFKKWKFKPGEKDGKPVKVVLQWPISFTIDTVHTSTAETQRTSYNLALGAVQENRVTQATIDSLQDLVAHDFAPGKYLYGVLLEKGQGVSADPAAGFKLIQEAADAKYAPAMYLMAQAEIKGDKLPQDRTKGMETMEKAAKLGSMPAGEYLGDAYETGTGVPLDLTKSRRFFRDCAALGYGRCQYRLAKSMLDRPEKGERDFVDAIAWLELAAAAKVDDAVALLDKERGRITPEQAAAADKLKARLLHRP